MPRQKSHHDRIYQTVGEPGPGSIVVGYVRYSSEMQDPTTIATQRRRIVEFAERKGWKVVHWYEEPEQSAKHEEIERRPVFAQLLNDAESKQFQVVLCYVNNRWARNTVSAYTSLSRLRSARVWWATSDGLWDIDKVQQDGFDVAFAVDTQMNAAYVRQLSKRTIDGKEDRAREGYHNGNVMFGYLPPEYQKAPDGAPSTWRPPRTPVRPDPITFPALVRIGELAAQGWTDRAIADELDSYLSRTARFGERLLTKDTVAGIRRSWFPREFAPGSSYGTIDTPSGELVEGKHQAAWSYDLWQKMIETKASQYRRPTKGAQRRPHEFSRIIVCAACRRPLRIILPNGIPYYQDSSVVRKLDCSIPEPLSIRESTVIYQFGDILRSIDLPESWRNAIARQCSSDAKHKDESTDQIKERRADLETEQKRLVTLFTKGYITENDLDTKMEDILSELFSLPVIIESNAEESTQAAIAAGETLVNIAGYWSEALAEERRDIVWSLLMTGGLVYDLERAIIIGLLPRANMLPALTLGLENSGRWEQRDNSLWLRSDFFPPKLERTKRNLPPPLTGLEPGQRPEVVRLLSEDKMSLRQVADILGTSRETIRRVALSEGIELQTSQKLTLAEREGALALLDAGLSLRQVARQYGVSPESIRRLAKRHN
ncbi:recombinase family protein [Dictyobacter kobayashii]|uniref:Resolvase/invertase-type recombinase catalytic domain-containing protein n=1 Tax=Dictyobacter kobayashii TaxID=2014872 RepID=A0A402ALX0_9CHLR|nr:recombinase family protein [Dictyobacter kobayashii]GCE20039.1 hypothetical protein KDK_38390 [Dictyobacter kobayashii]